MLLFNTDKSDSPISRVTLILDHVAIYVDDCITKFLVAAKVLEANPVSGNRLYDEDE